MLKLQTPVLIDRSTVQISLTDRVMILGSCFAEHIGGHMRDAGFDVMLNPTGTLYNPVSIADTINRISTGTHFTHDDCAEMGAGAGLICSFHHHTAFARPTAEDFLAGANAALDSAHDFWQSCGKVIITLGTAWRFVLREGGYTVANCLKRPAREFDRSKLSLDEVSSILADLLSSYPDKQFIFTVSPVRHMADGAHANQLSKSTLLMAVDSVHEQGRAEYFPAYEIMMDELRDYRFYAEDMAHPTTLAASYIWERFRDFAVPESEHTKLAANEKITRQSRHKNIH